MPDASPSAASASGASERIRAADLAGTASSLAYRSTPEKIVLAPRPGAGVSASPPVTIFLGTEDAQHRAERVFLFSIEKYRDPSRTYEIYVMKNIGGFAREDWRTGFTNYRFAIPDWAGRSGKAIYNDVDQIYLTDPAELFDLDLGGHGYLSVSAEDTSVMVLDCARMTSWWNLDRAITKDKGCAPTPGFPVTLAASTQIDVDGVPSAIPTLSAVALLLVSITVSSIAASMLRNGT